MATKKEVKLYKVHSGVRKLHTKLVRRKTPGRHRFVQRLLGGAVIVRRARSATITEDQLLNNLEEFKRAEREGRTVVKTVTGERVDLDTMKPIPKAPAPPKPKPPMDSIANDKTFEHGVGEHIPKYPDGKGIAEEVEPLDLGEIPDGKATLAPEEAPPVADPVETRKQKRKRGK